MPEPGWFSSSLAWAIQVFEKYAIGDFASVIGLLVALLGFGITIFNTAKSKKAALQAVEAVRQMQNKVARINTISDCTLAHGMLEEIVRLQRQRDWKVVIERYRELRNCLINTRGIDHRLGSEQKAILQAIITDAADMQNNIEGVLQRKGTAIDVVTANKLINDHAENLQKLIAQLKREIGGGEP